MPGPEIIVVVTRIVVTGPPRAAIKPAHITDILHAIGVAAAVAAAASPLAGIADACPIADSAVSTAARANPPIFHIAIAALLSRVATQAEVFHSGDVTSLKEAVSKRLT